MGKRDAQREVEVKAKSPLFIIYTPAEHIIGDVGVSLVNAETEFVAHGATRIQQLPDLYFDPGYCLEPARLHVVLLAIYRNIPIFDWAFTIVAHLADKVVLKEASSIPKSQEGHIFIRGVLEQVIV